jgi:copper transport protein
MRSAGALLGALGVLGAFAPSALAHAQLLNTVPARDATVARQPAEVIFEYNQPVGGALGAIKVYNAQGEEVDNNDVSHPSGRESWLGVGLKAHLPDGTYIATYRVISADTHIVYGGNTFSIGAPGAAPVLNVSQLIAKNKTGEITEVAFGVVKALDYASIALMIGVLSFLAFVWLPGLAAIGNADRSWAQASERFARGALYLLIGGVVLGVLVAILGFVFQGASEAGVSFWSAINGHILNTVLDSRFGWVWGTRGLTWIAFGLMLAVAARLRPHAVPVLTPVALGADGAVLHPARNRLALAGGAAPAAYLAITPALSGHASVASPRGVLFPADVLHVLAMSIWLGGLLCLVVALPLATRALEPPQRSRLLAGMLVRFSPIALACVLTLLVTGVVQGYIHIRSWHGLFDTGYGRAVIIKFAALMLLVGLGALNRQRSIPALRRAVSQSRSPGEIGVLLRRTLRAEVVLVLIVLGVTGALVGYAPPVEATQGPFSTTAMIGPAELEMDVDPAQPGPNTIHIYLINPRDGSQFTATKELDVLASLPAKAIGPLTLTATPAGPGHYIVGSAELIPAGTWTIELTDRVSQFDEYSKTIKVPIQ